MRTRLKQLGGRTDTRFIVVGASNFAWGLASFPLFYVALEPLGLNYICVLVLTYAINTTVSFISQKYLVFRTKGRHFSELSRFLVLQGILLAINLFILPILVISLDMPPIIAQTAFALALAIGSYFFHKYVTFRTRRTET